MVKKYLGLDLGTKTLGIAYNDALGFVHGLETFRFDKNQYIVARKHVIELSEKMMINDIVNIQIYYPFVMGMTAHSLRLQDIPFS